MDLPASSPSTNPFSRNVLHKPDDKSNLETILKLHIRIEELEAKLKELYQSAQRRELELHKQFDEKKYSLIIKYLETKLQLQRSQEFSKRSQTIWNRDMMSLCNTVRILLNKAKEKDTLYIQDLAGLDKDLTDSVMMILNSHIMYKGDLDNLSNSQSLVDDNNLSIENFPKTPKIRREKQNRQERENELQCNTLLENKSEGLQSLEDYQSKSNTNSGKTQLQYVLKDSTLHTRRTSLNTLSSLASIMEPLQKKIKNYINKLNYNRKNVEEASEESIKKTLQEIESHLWVENDSSKFQVNEGKELGSSRDLSNLDEKSQKQRKETNISKVYAILGNNIIPNKQTVRCKEGDFEKSEKKNKIIDKIWSLESLKENVPQVKRDTFQILQDPQISLTASDKEFLMDNLRNNKEKRTNPNNMRFEEFLAAPYPQSKNDCSSPSLCIKCATHINSNLGQFKTYSAYDENTLPLNSKSIQIINNNLSEQFSRQNPRNTDSYDIIDARKYLNSYYNQNYQRNESSYQSERSQENYSRFLGEVSGVQNPQEQIFKENISPILPRRNTCFSRNEIFEEGILEQIKPQVFGFNDASLKESLPKSDLENKNICEMIGTLNNEVLCRTQTDSNKQSIVEKITQVSAERKIRDKGNGLFCFPACGNKF